MTHDLPLVTTIAAAFGLALVLGFVAERLRLPALVGYLFAGIVIGPATPGFVADMSVASQLSEIGVMLLMFGVGLHFSLDDLLAVKRIAVPGAVVQMALATALGIALAVSWGWSFGAALIFGLSLSCASTVVLIKALESRGRLESPNGQIAVGWLVVEDLATVLVLVLLPPLAGLLGGAQPANPDAHSLWWVIGQTLLQVAAFVAIMLIAGRRVLPWLLWRASRAGSRELFTLSVVTAAIGVAYGAAHLFNVSFALGAFFAGMMLRESEFSHRAAQESLPLRDAFSVLFFVGVGMLFDPAVVVDQPLRVAGVVAIVILGKSLAAMALVLAFRYPLNSALTVAASLAQIGEFSFILAGLGASLGLLPDEGMSLVLAAALISIALNPLVFALVEPFGRWALKNSELARRLERRGDPYAELPMSTERKYLTGQIVLVGYGRVGRRIAEGLSDRGLPYIVADRDRSKIEALRARGIHSVSGDAIEPSVLIQAHVAEAALLIIAVPDTFAARQMLHIARTLNPRIEVVLRCENDEECRLLKEEGCNAAFFSEQELAKGMMAYVVERFSLPEAH